MRKNGRKCTIAGCGNGHFGLGWCNLHYQRVRKRVSPDAPKKLATEDRFWSKVDIRSPDECWPWKENCNRQGYGLFSLRPGKPVRAHRFAYQNRKGTLLPGQIVRHACDNPPCCNPYHLLAGSHQDNADDRTRRQRQARGVGNAAAKLTQAQVLSIRVDPRPQRTIAIDYGICKTTVGYIKRGETWRHLDKCIDLADIISGKVEGPYRPTSGWVTRER